MAHGHGGRRVGAGRKPQSSLIRAITGNPGRRGRVLTYPSAGDVPAVVPADEFDAPDGLTTEERAVWLELAPYAFATRTLTRATAFAFRLLCQNICRERALGKNTETCNSADHRGLIREVNTRLLQFQLAPCGKPLYEAAPAVAANPLDRFLKKV